MWSGIRPMARLALLLVGLLARPSCAADCKAGEPVAAFFAGEVDRGNGPEACKPDMELCFFPGKIASGPDADGTYTIDWDDGDANNRKVQHASVKHASSGQACSGPLQLGTEADDHWTPPEIACTILPRLHWEGSDPEWNSAAIALLRQDYQPDELIDGFDWHVILRFYDVNRCERTYAALDKILKSCTDQNPDACRTHKYVKAIEYVGDDPETRRKSGRHVFVPTKEARDEL